MIKTETQLLSEALDSEAGREAQVFVEKFEDLMEAAKQKLSSAGKKAFIQELKKKMKGPLF